LIAEFMRWLNKKCPELDGGVLSRQNKGQANLRNHYLSVGLSAGLRALHDNGIIDLDFKSDSTDIWFLSKANYLDRISHIKVRGE
ncbi:MAG: hypothetical protein ACOCRO_10490, partial [Halanaerobiales bacterium]